MGAQRVEGTGPDGRMGSNTLLSLVTHVLQTPSTQLRINQASTSSFYVELCSLFSILSLLKKKKKRKKKQLV